MELAGIRTTHLSALSRRHRTVNERPAFNQIYCHILYSFLYLYLFIDVSLLQKSNVAVNLAATLSRIQKDSIQVSVPTTVARQLIFYSATLGIYRNSMPAINSATTTSFHVLPNSVFNHYYTIRCCTVRTDNSASK
jgi:hypothetical protein